MKALVLLSGGIDSTTCLALAVEKYGKENIGTLSVYYGQKHDKELQAAEAVAKHYAVPRKVIDLKPIFDGSDCSLLKDSEEEIPMESYAEQISKRGGKPVSTYVPFRNGLFLATAASIAIADGYDEIYYGAHADDSAGNAYPDCSPDFNRAITEAIYKGSGNQVKVVAPLIAFNKSQVVRMGLYLRAPYDLTWSCYSGGDKPCGTCGTCIDRKKAFESNGVEDPVL